MERKFPFKIKNVSGSTRVVGSLWLPPQEEVKINKAIYQLNKDSIELDLEIGGIVIIEEAPEIVEKAHSDEPIKQEGTISDATVVETIDKDSTVKVEKSVEKSIVAKYHDKELTWQEVVKEIGSVNYTYEELYDLYQEGLELGVKIDGVVMKSLMSAMQDAKGF